MSKKCVCGRSMVLKDWKRQWVCTRCGRTKPIDDGEFGEDTNVLTNADRIRSMTDEELAEWMEHYNVDCRICSEYQRCKGEVVFHYAPCDMECSQHYLKWLKQPYEEIKDDQRT